MPWHGHVSRRTVKLTSNRPGDLACRICHQLFPRLQHMASQVIAMSFLLTAAFPYASCFVNPALIAKGPSVIDSVSRISRIHSPGIHRYRKAPLLLRGSSSNATPELYNDLKEVRTAIIKAGLEASELIIAVDFTQSNLWNGADSFNGFGLHDVSRADVENPYQKTIRIVGNTLSFFDDDSKIPAFGFGDVETAPKGCFEFFDDKSCSGTDEVLSRYREIASKIKMAGPTNFAPVIRKAIEIVKKTRKFHVLVIIADGQVDQKVETIDAIVEASNHPLAIVCIGVGDGPWETMKQFDDDIPKRRFDNFNFVCLPDLERKFNTLPAAKFEAEFARAALMELPDLYSSVRTLGLL
jgi:E3 ubiquitin-protein ligase RGLG